MKAGSGVQQASRRDTKHVLRIDSKGGKFAVTIRIEGSAVKNLWNNDTPYNDFTICSLLSSNLHHHYQFTEANRSALIIIRI